MSMDRKLVVVEQLNKFQKKTNTNKQNQQKKNFSEKKEAC